MINVSYSLLSSSVIPTTVADGCPNTTPLSVEGTVSETVKLSSASNISSFVIGIWYIMESVAGPNVSSTSFNPE